MRNTVIEIRNSMDRLIHRIHTERISSLEDRFEGIFQNAAYRDRKYEKIRNEIE